jgi:hypothetical protein
MSRAPAPALPGHLLCTAQKIAGEQIPWACRCDLLCMVMKVWSRGSIENDICQPLQRAGLANPGKNIEIAPPCDANNDDPHTTTKPFESRRPGSMRRVSQRMAPQVKHGI